jgi:hypothetical protein
MAKSDNLKPVGPFDQNMETKGTVTSQEIGGPSDSEQADAAFAVQKAYSGDRSPTPPKADR